MNQQEIARKLGVSQTAVSLVLNNPETTKVSPEKKALIRRCLKEANYFNAAQLRRTWNIGLAMNVMPFGANSEFYHRFVDGIERATEKEDYSLFVEYFRGDELNIVKRRKVDGVIGGSQYLEFRHTLPDPAGIPLVVLNAAEPELRHDTVMPDNFGAMHDAVDHLVKLGHRRIAFLAMLAPDVTLIHNPIMMNLTERHEGFQRACRYLGTELDEEDYIRLPRLAGPELGDTVASIAGELRHWRRLTRPPTAVVCSNDGYAATLLRCALDAGLRVPGDLSIMGVDNKGSNIADGSLLTTIDQNFARMGQLAAELLLKRIQHPDAPVVRLNCQSTLVVRSSTGPCPPERQANRSRKKR